MKYEHYIIYKTHLLTAFDLDMMYLDNGWLLVSTTEIERGREYIFRREVKD